MSVRAIVIVILCVSPSAFALPTRAISPSESDFTECKRYPSDKRFKLTLRGEVELFDLVAAVAGVGCRTIVMSPAVATRGGKIVVDVPDLVTAAEVYRIFRASLEILGLTVEKSGSLWKIVDAARARELSRIETAAASSSPASVEEFVTRLVRVRHVAPAELAEALGKLRSHDGEVSVYAPTSSILITDRASVVERMSELLPALDVASPGARLFTLSTHGLPATELAVVIDKSLDATRHGAQEHGGPRGQAGQPSAGGQGGPVLVPVDVAHTLIVVGEEADFRRVSALAARLDPPPAEGNTSQVHVIYLAHTNADEMVATLRDLGLATRGGARPAQGAAAAASPIQGDLRVSADKVSNAIVVFAGSADFATVRDLVARLDLPRRQVYVEAAILDLTMDDTSQLGLGLHGGAASSSSGTAGVVASGSSDVSSLVTSAASLAALFASGGLTAGVFGAGFTYGGITIPSFGVVLKALEQSKNADVLSQPHVLTLDHEKASLSVGQSIPFPTQSLSSLVASTATPSLLNAYQRQDVALKLELTPHVSDDAVRMEIDGEISDVPDGQSSAAPGGPTTDKRTLKTSVLVGDGETVVLGGLEKQTFTERIERIPLLGDLPIIGRLFQTRNKQRIKQSLVVAITPYIIRGPDDLKRIFERKMRDQREFENAMSPDRKDALHFTPHVDYSRKRGLLFEIESTGRHADEEADLVRRASEGRRMMPEGEVK